MPVRRTPDGKIIEEKTQIKRSNSPGSEGPTTVDPNSRRPSSEPPAGGGRFDAETVVVPRGGADKPADSDGPTQRPQHGALDTGGSADDQGAGEQDDNRTRLVGFGTSDSEPTGAAQSGSGFNEPVTGWLVVVKGPGRGRFAPVGLGRNTVGRAPTERVVLDFGDTTISRESHMIISYDHKGRQFYLQPGEGQNLTYLNDSPVLSTEVLQNGALITLGDTEVQFVAFCGEAFDWSDAE